MTPSHSSAAATSLFSLPSGPVRIYALVDCNNFYVSCERIFNAAIAHKPVIVLGNNDGCIVARSNEAKMLGLPMGAPAFQYQHLIDRYGVIVYSSNYALYQDISDRIMRLLKTFSPQVECYSIDEAWLDVSHVPFEKLYDYGQMLRARILQYTGIPVSVGIAPNKTLTKIACEIVKHNSERQGVLSLVSLPEAELDALLATIPVANLWGIGKQSAITLERQGIVSAKALKYAETRWVRRHLHVLGERIVWELRGAICYPLEPRRKSRQGIMTSLSFSRPIKQIEEMMEAVATYTVRAAEKLRRQESVAGAISVFLHTNPFDTKAPQYAASASRTLLLPTAWTPTLITTALDLLKTLFKPEYRYKKAGVYLSQLRSQEVLQADLFGLASLEEQARQMRLMCVVDAINQHWGNDTLFYGAQGIHRGWQMRQTRRSPRYTTRWGEILQVT
jgi:DNA polymerase V